MRIGIVGSAGVVGNAVQYGMEKLGHDVSIHDVVLDTKLSDVYQTDLCFICVPTPKNPDGSCNISIVEEVIEDLQSMEYQGIICIKSTVWPGMTALQNKYRKRYTKPICFVPEFLRERCAISDFTENHDVCVIGCSTDEQFELIKKAHGKYPKKFVRMSTTEAELSKYFSNVFNALRITFANGFYEICQKLEADYSKIKNAVVQRPTMTDMYLDCNEKFRGFGGVCLPKDSAALAKLAKDLGVEAEIFNVIVEDNKLYNTTIFDKMRHDG